MTDTLKTVDDIIKQEDNENKITLSDRAADVVSEFGGSWAFVFIFLLFFTFWITFNLYIYTFDTYPFILLNLILSCIAVFQAPFILMSQNRMAKIDRKRAENVYRVDLYNELEIVRLHEKLDIIIKQLSHENK